MKQRISLFIITLSLMLSSCSSGDDYSSFIAEDTDKYNSQISSAIDVNEAWASTP